MINYLLINKITTNVIIAIVSLICNTLIVILYLTTQEITFNRYLINTEKWLCFYYLNVTFCFFVILPSILSKNLFLHYQSFRFHFFFIYDVSVFSHLFFDLLISSSCWFNIFIICETMLTHFLKDWILYGLLLFYYWNLKMLLEKW